MSLAKRNFGKMMEAREMPASFKDLREPICLYRSHRAPSEDLGFRQTLTKYADAWAKVTYGEQKVLGGEESDPKMIHFFWIRNEPHFSVEIRDYVQWGNRLFEVKSTHIADERRMYLRLRCNEYNTTDGVTAQSGSLQRVIPAAPHSLPHGPDTGVPFW